MWWLIPAGLTAAILAVVVYVVGQTARRHSPGYDGLTGAFLLLAAAALSLVWGAYFAIGAVLG